MGGSRTRALGPLGAGEGKAQDLRLGRIHGSFLSDRSHRADLLGMTDSRAPTPTEFEQGRGLVFLLGAFRSGTTLLRKMLDSHPQIHSPAETWFLLPLVNLWEGVGECPLYKPAQAGAAIRHHLLEDQFLACCRAFAGRFYASNMPAGSRVFVDKTPPYLSIAGALPRLFPRARFIVLARDPRGVLWSRHTWKHAVDSTIPNQIKGVAGDVRRLASFYQANRAVSSLVHYEQVCRDPGSVLEPLCADLGVEFDPRMVHYGRSTHHEGYGDEKTREHKSPHAQSVDRWAQGVSEADGQHLLDLCTPEALNTLGLGGESARQAA
jgi:sulfotransferase family protein